MARIWNKHKQTNTPLKRKVFVAMSGGVDSSVAAAFLVAEGYDVIGAFMKNWDGCDWKRERRDALRVASTLGITLHTFDFEREYRERVHTYMVSEYREGRTPNPDVLCNSEIKFDLLLRAASELGCEKMATGHYARVQASVADAPLDRSTSSRQGVARGVSSADDVRRTTYGVRYRLLKGVDGEKDQSYFLCRLGQKELARVLFPVGDLKKSEVRKQAHVLGLPTATKKDSQGLCFIGKVDFASFLQNDIAPRIGNIVTTSGEVIGTHEGVAFYTIGQRKGLGVGGTEPYFVVERRLSTNELVVAHEGDPALFSKSLTAADVQWTLGEAPPFPYTCAAKIRYRHSDQACTVVSALNETVLVTFDEPQRAVAPGQFVVFYQGDELVGSGVIESRE